MRAFAFLADQRFSGSIEFEGLEPLPDELMYLMDRSKGLLLVRIVVIRNPEKRMYDFKNLGAPTFLSGHLCIPEDNSDDGAYLGGRLIRRSLDTDAMANAVHRVTANLEAARQQGKSLVKNLTEIFSGLTLSAPAKGKGQSS